MNAPTVRSRDRPSAPPRAVIDEVEQARVFEALFQVPAERQRMGRYVVLGVLGRGGMSTVLEAFDRTLDRRVALKVLHRTLGEENKRRLLREAQALAKLSHPNVVQVYEVGEADGQAFIALELVQGRSLQRWLSQDPRPEWPQIVQVYLQAGEGLAAAHARGLIHRDFKPGNAVIDDDGRVRVLDFGLARRTDYEHRSTSVNLSVEEAALELSLTQTGTVMGTPAYMAPEQMQGHDADPRSDQFGYCVSLFEALHGHRPYDGDSMTALITSIATGRTRPVPKSGRVPARLQAAVLRGLAPDPSERWPSMEALLEQLRRASAPRRRGRLALGATLGVGLGLAAMGLGLAHYAEVGFRCDGAGEQLGEVWNAQRRRQIEHAVVGTKVARASYTWGRVEQQLDAYAEAWAEEHREVCEATSVRQEQSAEVMDLRMACLHTRLVALEESLGVLAEANEVRVRRAMDVVSGLPRLTYCEDVEALRAELPPPEDPEVARQVTEQRERLALVSSLYRAGEYDQSLDEVEQIVPRAEALGYVPLLTDALLRRADAQYYRDQTDEAQRDYERAFALAAEHGHRRAEVEALLGLAWVVGVYEAHYDEGLRMATLALPLSKGPGIEPRVEGDAHNCLGVLLLARDARDEAMEQFQRALAIYEQIMGPDHPSLAPMLSNIGVVLHGQGRLDEALTHYRRALETWKGTLGPAHQKLGKLMMYIGNVLHDQGQLDEARAKHEQALAILESAVGDKHPWVALSAHHLGKVLLDQGQPEAAKARFERSWAIGDEAFDARHPSLARPLLGLAEVALVEQDEPTAREHAERAVTILRSSEPSSSRLAEARFVLARALWPDPEQRARAVLLAEQAREAYVELGESERGRIDAVDAWLDEHPIP